MLTADKSTKFLEFVLDCYFEQHVREPTRIKNVLDLVLTNDLEIKNGIQINAPVDTADHNVLL